ncbi:MAG: hypothetical protein V2J10_09300 [Wenzhouxiangella sp.]|jgi:hypothetical protein|nr:hypothetical protein [Wenzhouxiangella sp.]
MIRAARSILLLCLLALLIPLESKAGLLVPFTYQGELTEAGEPANGTYDFRFQVFNLNRGDSQSSQPRFVDDVSVVNGIFTVELDFNSRFENFSRLYLEVAVRPAGSGEYTTLSPRQPLHAALRSEYALNVRDGSIDNDALADNAVRAENVDFEDIQLRVNGQCPSSAIRIINDSGGVTCAEPFWTRTGNAGTAAGTDFIGTTDEVPFDIRANDRRAMRFEWGFSGTGGPNLTGGHANNSITPDNEASVIAGGGVAAAPNSISASYGAIGGGTDNQVNASWGTIPGGSGNRVDGSWGFAAGQGARALHNNSFVWNDGGTFASTGPDQFLIDAGGGVGIGTNNPSDLLHISAPDNTDAMRIQIGGQTRFRVHDNGGVSIGVNATPPAGGLLVRGDVRLEDPVTRWLHMNPMSFEPITQFEENHNFIRGRFRLRVNASIPCSGNQLYGSPVHLPHDVVVTQLLANIWDGVGAGQDMTVRLVRFSQSSGDLDIMAEVESSGSPPTALEYTDDTIGNARIDNEEFQYTLEVSSPCNTGPYELNAVRLAYETASLVDS